MPEKENSYLPAGIRKRFRRQAWRVWAVTLAIASVWTLSIIVAPVAKANGLQSVAAPIYGFFSFACHQIPSRSFNIEGEQFAVCSRCFGVYFGLLLGVLAFPFWRGVTEIEPLPRFWLILSVLPAAMDWSLTIFGVWENTHLSRLTTGLLLGFACGTFIVPGVVEATRNLTSRKYARQSGING